MKLFVVLGQTKIIFTKIKEITEKLSGQTICI